jgi:hypothetical protein
MYKCEILADSINSKKDRITTFKVTYPRIIHAEMCRHRMLSRNSASSRAIPFTKMLQMVTENPFIPIAWQKDHKGMQGVTYIRNKKHITNIINTWLRGRDNAVEVAASLNVGFPEFKTEMVYTDSVTKQLCNRLLEPFLWHTEIITGTEWENFFSLRCPKYTIDGVTFFRSIKDVINDSNYDWNNEDHTYEVINGNIHISNNNGVSTYHNESQAEIHIQKIAEMMWDSRNESTPKQLEVGEWHIPFSDNINYEKLGEVTGKYYIEDNPNEEVDINKWLVKIATARCARISYETLGDNSKIDYEADIKLHDMLIKSKHWSPFEHCARAMNNIEYEHFIKGDRRYDVVGDKMLKVTTGWCNNFKGFIQYRYSIDNGN